MNLDERLAKLEEEVALDEKKKKKPYSSMTITTGDPAYNAKQFNKHAGTDFPSPDGANTPTLGSGYMAGGSEGASASAGASEGAGGGLSEGVLDEDKIYAAKMEDYIELPANIKIIPQEKVEEAIRQLSPEEQFEVGYVTPIYFYKDLWDKFMLIKCTQFVGYTGVDYREVRSQENSADQVANRKKVAQDQINVGNTEIRTQSNRWKGKEYSDTNKTIFQHVLSQDDAGNDIPAVKLNTILYYPDTTVKPTVIYYIDLHNGRGYQKVARDVLERTIFAKVAEYADLKINDTALRNKIHGILDTDKSTTGKEVLKDVRKHEWSVNKVVDKPQVRALYTNQIYYLKTTITDLSNHTQHINLGTPLYETLKEAHYDPADYWDEDPRWWDVPGSWRTADRDLINRAKAQYYNKGYTNYGKASRKDYLEKNPDSITPLINVTDAPVDKMKELYKKRLGEKKLDVRNFHAAYDQLLDKAGYLINLFNKDGVLKGKWTYGKIKDIHDFHIKAILSKFWKAQFIDNCEPYYGTFGEALDLNEAKRYVRRYYIRPQNIFCSNKDEILKALIDTGNQNCTIYTLNNLGDIKDVHRLTNKDIIYYYDEGILYDKNHVRIMDYDLSIKKEEDRKKYPSEPNMKDLNVKHEYEDRMTSATELEEDYEPDFKNDNDRRVFNELYIQIFKDTGLIGKDLAYKTFWKGGSQTPHSTIDSFKLGDDGSLIVVLKLATGELRSYDLKLFFKSIRSNFKVGARSQLVSIDADVNRLFNEWHSRYTLKAVKKNKEARLEANWVKREEAVKALVEKYKNNTELKDWLVNNVESIKIILPYSSSGAEFGDLTADIIDRFEADEARILGMIKDLKTGDIEYRDADLKANDAKARVDMFRPSAIIKFLNKLETAPEIVKEFIKDCKQTSINQKTTADADFKEELSSVSSLYMVLAVIGIFNDTIHFMKYKKEDSKPENELDIDFPEVKESINDEHYTCCICGEEFDGFGNNPDPVKEEGRCCDACNLKFVIPARMDSLEKKDN